MLIDYIGARDCYMSYIKPESMHEAIDLERLKSLVGCKWNERDTFHWSNLRSISDLFSDNSRMMNTTTIGYVVMPSIGCVGMINKESPKMADLLFAKAMGGLMMDGQSEKYIFQPREFKILEDLFATAAQLGLLSANDSKPLLK